MRMREKTGWQVWIVYNKEFPGERGGMKSRKSFCCDEYSSRAGEILLDVPGCSADLRFLKKMANQAVFPQPSSSANLR